MKKDYTGTIKSIKNIALNTFEMKISSELNSAKSGQFISIYCPNKTLRRPFSIADFQLLKTVYKFSHLTKALFNFQSTL